jgi:hypothetical protein
MATLSSIAGLLAVWITAQGSPPPAPGCYLLTMPEVASIIGTASPRIVTAGPSCTYENGRKAVTVRIEKPGSADAVRQRWEDGKRAASAKDVPGWPTPAYLATVDTAKEHSAVVGLSASDAFVEAKAIDADRKVADLSATLQAAMKALSGRLAAQK